MQITLLESPAKDGCQGQEKRERRKQYMNEEIREREKAEHLLRERELDRDTALFRVESLEKERQHWPWSGDWPQQDARMVVDTGDGLIVYGAYSWWPRGSVRQYGAPTRSDERKLPDFPKISNDYVWSPLPWDYPTSKEDWLSVHANEPRRDYNNDPDVKQKMQSATIDRRVDNIVLSVENYDPNVELFGGKYFINTSRILKLYNNEPSYTPIDRFQLRRSLKERIEARYEAKIDRLIEKMLFRTLHPIDNIFIAAMETTEEFFPGCFLYEGTRRIKLPEEDKQLTQKAREYRLAARGRYEKTHPQRFALVDRKYNVGSEIKTITFAFAYKRIYFQGEDLNNKFENFFLSEAIKRGYIEKSVEAKEAFLSRFRQLDGYVANSSISSAFYLWQPGVKGPV